MTKRFVQLADRSWIAVNRIASMRHAPDRHAWIVVDVDGNEAETRPGFEPDSLDTTVVPASPGQTVSVIYLSEFEARPGVTDIVHEQFQIVAWQVTALDDALPVVATSLPDEVLMLLVERPGGTLCDVFSDEAFASLDDAREEALQRAQSNWDREQGADQTAEPATRQVH